MLGLLNEKGYVAAKLKKENPTDELIEILVNYRHFRLLNEAGLTDRTLKIMSNLAIGGMYSPNNSPNTELEWFATMMSLHQYQLAFTRDGDEPLEIALRQSVSWQTISSEQKDRDINSTILGDVESQTVEAYKILLSTPISELATNISLWCNFVELARKAWGDCPAIDRIAFTAAGIRNRSELGQDAPLENTDNLVASARYMRLKSGAPQWWRNLLSSTPTSGSIRRVLIMLFLWATGRTLVQITAEIEDALSKLDDPDWRMLYRDVKFAMRREDNRNDNITSKEIGGLKSRSSRFLTMIGLRTSIPVRAPLALELAERDLSHGSPEVQFSFSTLVVLRDKLKTGKILDGIAYLYLRGGSMPVVEPRERQIDRTAAEKISSEAERFPFRLLGAADRSLTSIATSRAPKMQEVSLKERWFEDQLWTN